MNKNESTTEKKGNYKNIMEFFDLGIDQNNWRIFDQERMRIMEEKLKIWDEFDEALQKRCLTWKHINKVGLGQWLSFTIIEAIVVLFGWYISKILF